MATAASQYQAIQNGANQNSLVNQLFGKPTLGAPLSGSTTQAILPTPSVTSTAPMQAASFAVKNTTSPTYNPGTSQNGGTVTQNNTMQNLSVPNSGNFTTPSGAVVNSGTGSLVSPSQSQAPSFSGILGNLSNFNPFSNPQLGKAYNAAQDINTQLEQSKTNEANAIAQNRLNPIPIGDQTGREAVIQNQYLQQQNALAGQFQGQSNLVNAGLTGTGQELSGLNTSAGLTKPEGNFPFVFNPATGQFSAPGVGGTGSAGAASGAPTVTYNPTQDAQTFAQAVIQNKVPYADAVNAMGYAGSTGKTLLTNAITSLGGNLTQIEAQQGAIQSNIQTAGTAGVNAQNAAYGTNYQNYLQTGGQLQNVSGLGNLLLTTAEGGQINPFAPQFANQTLAQFRNQLSSPAQAQFNSTLAAFQGAASQLLANSSGQIPTDVSNNINAIANGSLSLSALQAMYQQALSEGQIKLGTAASLVNTPGSSLGAPQVTSNPSSTSNNPLGI